MHHRLLPFCTVILAVAFAVLLSRPSSSISAPISEPGSSSLRSTTGSITTITTDTITILTYPYAAYLFTATNTTFNMPYQWLHWAEYNNSHPQPVEKTYTRLILENEWLKVWLLPELGGRIYQIIYKPTGHGVLYNNWVIKPTNWGPPEQGWWLAAGGIEWGLPVEEHGYEWNIPWSYNITTGTDGITITLRDSTAPDRLRAAVGVFLPNDQGALRIHLHIENDRNVALNFKWWINAMIAPGYNTVGTSQYDYTQNVQFVYPTDQVTIHSTGDDALPGPNSPTGPTVSMPWPIYNGRDLSYLRNWRQFLGFFARPAAQSDIAAVYNANTYEAALKVGLVRIFPHQIATGLKGFGMGWNNPLPWNLWTDNMQYYVEMHGGLAPTFWDSASLAAHSSIEWDETWYPVGGLNGLTTGTAEAALNLEQTGSQLIVGLHSTRPHANAHLRVMRRYICQVLGDYELTDVRPGVPITRSIATTLQPQDVTVVFTADDQPLLLYQITNDGQAPTNVGAGAPGLFTTQPEIPIGVIASDWDCVRSFDVQVKDGLYGTWTNWLTGTMTTTNIFTGTHGHMYFFRARARDLAGNTSQYPDNIWGHTSTAVLLTPAPVLEWSQKFAPRFADSRQTIEYALSIYNTGNLTASVTLTDTLPISTTILTGTLWSSVPPLPSVKNNTLSWSGVISINTDIVINYTVSTTQDLPVATELLNTVILEGGALPISRTARVVVNPYRIWLPLIGKQFQ